MGGCPGGAASVAAMAWILLTNDDGVDSPALVPFARALGEIGDVRVVVPDRERSWIGKAITRFDLVTHDLVKRDGVEIHTVSGYPADAVQIGIHPLFDSPPELVVSGINLGFNYGAGYSLGSGTVGAAFEGWEAGIPAIAFSTEGGESWESWRVFARTEGARPGWERISAVSAVITDQIRGSGVFEHADIVSVNLPFEADLDTPRVVAHAARTRYGTLYDKADGGFSHNYWGDVVILDDMDGTDVAVADSGRIAITPMRAPTSPELPAELAARLQGPALR